jgi:hypothetical protein
MKTALLKPKFDFAELEYTAANYKLVHIFILKCGFLKVCSGRRGGLATDALVRTFLCLTVIGLNFEVSFHRKVSSNIFYFIASKINDDLRPS